MDNAFFEALNSLGSENGLDTDTLIEKVKSAMLKAARKAYPDSEDRITVEIDPTTKTFEMYLRQDVIDDEPIDENEINIAEAHPLKLATTSRSGWTSTGSAEPLPSPQNSPSRATCGTSTASGFWINSRTRKTTASPAPLHRSKRAVRQH